MDILEAFLSAVIVLLLIMVAVGMLLLLTVMLKHIITFSFILGITVGIVVLVASMTALFYKSDK